MAFPWLFEKPSHQAESEVAVSGEETLSGEDEIQHTLQRNLLSRDKNRPNSRRFSADMGHLQPFMRPNELKRMKVAAEALREIKNL